MYSKIVSYVTFKMLVKILQRVNYLQALFASLIHNALIYEQGFIICKLL